MSSPLSTSAAAAGASATKPAAAVHGAAVERAAAAKMNKALLAQRTAQFHEKRLKVQGKDVAAAAGASVDSVAQALDKSVCTLAHVTPPRFE